MITFLSSLLFAAALAGQPAPPPRAATPSADAELTLIQAQRGGDDRVLRWDRGVCVGVSGFGPQTAQFVADRISQRAREVGLSAGGSGCDANIIILVSDDPDGVARGVSRRRDFGGGGSSRTGSRQALDDFLNTDRPVRWWYIWQEVGEGGEPVTSDDRNRNIPELRVPDRGRVAGERNTRLAFTHVVIIADSAQVAGLNMTAFADYLAMAALAQVEARTDTGGQPSVMTLFSDQQAGRTPPTELTNWDQGRLQALYNAPR